MLLGLVGQECVWIATNTPQHVCYQQSNHGSSPALAFELQSTGIGINRPPQVAVPPCPSLLTRHSIALVKNEIRIVQASLLGSILANLLLILGMSFFLGGLRFREQIYNSTVTQMSACLLSLSVISLVLPTAFHASFRDYDLADEQSLKISRGTSVVSHTTHT